MCLYLLDTPKSSWGLVVCDNRLGSTLFSDVAGVAFVVSKKSLGYGTQVE